MKKVEEFELIESEGREIEGTNSVDLAKVIATTVAEALATAPNNASDMVKGLEVESEPVVVQKITVRLMLR